MSVSRRAPSVGLLLLAALAGCAERPPAEPSAGLDAPSELVPAALGAGEIPTASYGARRWQEQTRETFRRLDRNRDGFLDLEEIRSGFDALDLDGDGYVSRFEAAGLVAAGDRDGDGRLSRAELGALPAFALESDRDEDGRISAIEFSLVRTDQFVRTDRNRDGVLEPEEWARVPRFTLFRF
ncbi:MAG: EF-hand domain-containing protein [Geminicoccaceae bacterium]|nr:EF-hand domain-containing protein [Geminicoccaceae bacterium]MCX8099855.1 EF-hand domain-containing protein [Geminicoccaceae bacterium]MDW8371481.1 EF-hand domain-containing protein [Geminicoccaceae bacterium]